MLPPSGPCYPSASRGIDNSNNMYSNVLDSSLNGGKTGHETHRLRSFLNGLSMLKEKVNQMQSYVNIIVPQLSPQASQLASGHDESSLSSSMVANMGTMVQEIMVTASSMMFNCQQMALGYNGGNNDLVTANNLNSGQQLNTVSSSIVNPQNDFASQSRNNYQAFLDGESFYNWYNDNITCDDNNNNNNHDNSNNNNNSSNGNSNYHSNSDNNNNNNSFNNNNNNNSTSMANGGYRITGSSSIATTAKNTFQIGNKQSRKLPTKSGPIDSSYDIVEIDAADLLAKYTHYCQVCAKGFKRDANLRMHMRAHGDEYKSSAALINPLKKRGENNAETSEIIVPRKYSCPHEGCRWNKKHPKFQPLKSIICVKNHYKRSHCPKMYVCKRCNRKQFSVLSDLRTHEKHCGDLKWQCSCGTTFSRKDKLMGHVGLFIGHTPLSNPLGTLDNKLDAQHGLQIQYKD